MNNQHIPVFVCGFCRVLPICFHFVLYIWLRVSTKHGTTCRENLLIHSHPRSSMRYTQVKVSKVSRVYGAMPKWFSNYGAIANQAPSELHHLLSCSSHHHASWRYFWSPQLQVTPQQQPVTVVLMRTNRIVSKGCTAQSTWCTTRTLKTTGYLRVQGSTAAKNIHDFLHLPEPA